jgi:cytochrome c2
MRSLRNLGRFAITGACLFAIVVLTSNSASARPKYATVMSTTYEDLAKKHGKNGKLSCAVCHPTKDKKERNNYGAALGKVIGKKNESDEAKIKEALVKVAKEKSATEGKTFGDLIEAGELPGTKDVAK